MEIATGSGLTICAWDYSLNLQLGDVYFTIYFLVENWGDLL